ncbi:MAG: glycosyltransferase family 9 protein [Deltaproteobacteria bacterium]|nr:glycosyltransferase family 9 protein [Deltaproteobacteria bacterium]
MILTCLFSPLIYFLIAIRKKKTISKILIIQTAKIGDLICSTPVFREARKKYPDAHITVIANPVTKELLEHNPNIDEIITVKNTGYRGLSGKLRLSNLIRRGKYDIGICLNPNIPFAIALFWGLVPIRLSVMPDISGITFKLASVFFTYLEKHRRGRMAIETYLKMLKAIGIESSNITKEAYKSEDADTKVEQILENIDKPLIGIAVSSGNKLKELGAEKIIKLIDMLLEDIDVYVVLIGSNQDKNTADIISNSVIQKNRIVNVTDKLSLSELPALIEMLSLFIGVDTGITYMADALSIPLINIAGPANMNDQRPTGKCAIIIHKQLPCVPCSHAFRSPYNCRLNSRECIESQSIKEIYQAVKIFFSIGC